MQYPSTSQPAKGAVSSPRCIIGFVLLLVLAASFFFSGISKLYDPDSFAVYIMDAGLANRAVAAMLANLFIGLELMLGVWLIFHFRLQSVTLPAVLVLLLLFSGYLVLLIIRYGDSGNCGCFGDLYAMKPSAGILKNLVLAGVAVLVLCWYPVHTGRRIRRLALLLALLAGLLPFILFQPADYSAMPAVINRPVNLDVLYRPGTVQPGKDLRQGKHVIAFLSTECRHCIRTASLLQTIYRQHPEIPVFFVINTGSDRATAHFFSETRAGHVPSVLLTDIGVLAAMAGDAVPVVYWIRDGVAERESSYFRLDPEHMKAWLAEK